MLKSNTLNFIQSSPLATWEITHNLNCAPNCDVYTVINGIQQKLYPLDIVYVNPTLIRIVFSSPRTGGARLVGNYRPMIMDTIGSIDLGSLYVSNGGGAGGNGNNNDNGDQSLNVFIPPAEKCVLNLDCSIAQTVTDQLLDTSVYKRAPYLSFSILDTQSSAAGDFGGLTSNGTQLIYPVIDSNGGLNSLKFDKSSGYGTEWTGAIVYDKTPDFDLENKDFTIEFMVMYENDFGYQKCIFALNNTNNTYPWVNILELYVSDNGAYSKLLDINGSHYVVNCILPNGGSIVNGWHHVALVRNGQQIRLYIDGFGGNAITLPANTYFNKTPSTHPTTWNTGDILGAIIGNQPAHLAMALDSPISKWPRNWPQNTYPHWIFQNGLAGFEGRIRNFRFTVDHACYKGNFDSIYASNAISFTPQTPTTQITPKWWINDIVVNDFQGDWTSSSSPTFNTTSIVRLSSPPPNGWKVSIDYATGTASNISNAASPNDDFISKSGTIIFDSSNNVSLFRRDSAATRYDLTLQIVKDGIIENTEYLNVSLTNPQTLESTLDPNFAIQHPTTQGSHVNGKITIEDGLSTNITVLDILNNGVSIINATDAPYVSVIENSNNISFVIGMTAPADKPITVSWNIAAPVSTGSHLPTAQDGVDFTGSAADNTSGIITFAPGETQKTINLSLINREGRQGGRAFVLKLSGSDPLDPWLTQHPLISIDTEETVTIIEDYVIDAGFNVVSAVNETVGNVPFTLQLAHAHTSDIIVNIEDVTSTITDFEPAVVGVDYSLPSSQFQVTIPAGQTSVDISVDIINRLGEQNYRAVKLKASSELLAFGGPNIDYAFATCTILDVMQGDATYVDGQITTLDVSQQAFLADNIVASKDKSPNMIIDNGSIYWRTNDYKRIFKNAVEAISIVSTETADKYIAAFDVKTFTDGSYVYIWSVNDGLSLFLNGSDNVFGVGYSKVFIRMHNASGIIQYDDVLYDSTLINENPKFVFSANLDIFDDNSFVITSRFRDNGVPHNYGFPRYGIMQKHFSPTSMTIPLSSDWLIVCTSTAGFSPRYVTSVKVDYQTIDVLWEIAGVETTDSVGNTGPITYGAVYPAGGAEYDVPQRGNLSYVTGGSEGVFNRIWITKCTIDTTMQNFSFASSHYYPYSPFPLKFKLNSHIYKASTKLSSGNLLVISADREFIYQFLVTLTGVINYGFNIAGRDSSGSYHAIQQTPTMSFTTLNGQQKNCKNTPEYDHNIRFLALPNSKFAVVWVDHSEVTPVGFPIYLQIYNDNGTVAHPAVRINPFVTAQSGTLPAANTLITTLNISTHNPASMDGGFLVAWSYKGSNIISSRTFDNNGDATVSISTHPLIIQQPIATTINAGQSAILSVTATSNTPLTYTWYSSGVVVGNSSSITVSPSSTKSYHCIISDGQTSIVSNTVAVYVTSAGNAPVITSQPTGTEIDAGSDAIIGIGASGTQVITYQLYSSVDGVNTLLTSKTGSYVTFTVSPTVTTDYYVVVSNSLGTVTSNTITITLISAPVITQQPSNVAITSGQTATLSVVATGTDPLTYAWYSGQFQVGSGPSITVSPNVTKAYSCVVSNDYGSDVSNTVTVTVTAAPVGTAPTITQQPLGDTILYGSNTPVVLTIAAAGSTPLTYAWYKGNTLVGSSSDLEVSVSETSSYYCIVSNAYGSATSSTATITVAYQPQITQQPVASTISAGGSATLSVTATGTDPLTYTWYRTSNEAVVGNTASISISPTSTDSYFCVVSNDHGSVTSDTVGVTVSAPAGTAPSITQQPVASTISAGGSATISVTATGTDPLTYTWYRASDEATIGTSATISISPTTTDSYFCVVNNGYGSATSNTAEVTVSAPVGVAPSITQHPVATTITSGQAATLSVTATGTDPLTYAWYRASDEATVGTAATISISPTSTESYFCTVNNGYGSAVSNTAEVTVSAAAGVAPSITQQPSSVSIIAGESTTLNVIATGDAPLTYQWYKNGLVVQGANLSNLQLTSVQLSEDGSSYTVSVSNAFGTVTSSSAILSVGEQTFAASITQHPSNVTVVSGSSATFSVVASGTAPLTYQWYKNSAAIAGATSSSYAETAVNNATYYVIVDNAYGDAVTSTSATLTVGIIPSITQQPSSATVISGQSVTLSVTADGTDPLSYTWYEGNTLAGIGNSISVSPTTASTYYCTVSNVYGSVNSNTANITVVEAPVIVIPPSNTIVSAGQNAEFIVTTSGTEPITYVWQESTDDGSTWSDVVAPAIVTPPSDITVTAGQNAELTVTTSGSEPITYVWQESTDDGSTWNNV